METTKVFSDLLAAYVDPAIRVIALKGSTRSGKTWAALQLLNTILHRTKKPRLISVVSETLPHLKRGCIRDFRNMLETDGIYNPKAWHDTDKIYRTHRGAMEFFSADSSDKVLGPARDILFINECINIPFEVYRQLAVRTTEKIILDYNPAYEFWVDSKIAPRADAVILHSTYLDNDMLTAAQIAEIESNRDADPDWWKVYGLGETGSAEGLVIKNWDIVAEMTKEFKREYIGLDFGYGNPTAIEHMRLNVGEVWIDEIAYSSGLTNPDIARIINDAGLAHLTIVADSAEPKSIQELKNAGLNVVPADKGDDSIRIGLQIMNRYKKHYTARSLGSIDENRKYRYPQDPNGNYDTRKPIPKHDHAKDAERYVFLKYFGDTRSGFDVTVSTPGRK